VAFTGTRPASQRTTNKQQVRAYRTRLPINAPVRNGTCHPSSWFEERQPSSLFREGDVTGSIVTLGLTDRQAEKRPQESTERAGVGLSEQDRLNPRGISPIAFRDKFKSLDKGLKGANCDRHIFLRSVTKALGRLISTKRRRDSPPESRDGTTRS